MSIEQPEALKLADILQHKIPSILALETAAAELRRLHTVNQALVDALQSVIAAVEACEGTWDDNDFPLHAHEKSGIWDDDNSNDQSGQPCVECAQWKAAKAALAKVQGDVK